MKKRKRLLGDDHPDTQTAIGDLALTYKEQGRLKDAEALEVFVVDKRKRLLGEEHPYTLRVCHT